MNTNLYQKSWIFHRAATRRYRSFYIYIIESSARIDWQVFKPIGLSVFGVAHAAVANRHNLRQANL